MYMSPEISHSRACNGGGLLPLPGCFFYGNIYVFRVCFHAEALYSVTDSHEGK